jgi:hypothetical protein
MADVKAHAEAAHAAVMQTVDDFHIKAVLDSGIAVSVPVCYQIREPGFRPFEMGKASPEQLQARYDEITADATSRKISLGLESQESVAKLLLQEGLGIDCSNFAFRALRRLHQQLGLIDYEQTVMWPIEKVRQFHETQSFWKHAKDEHNQPRDFTEEELRILGSMGDVSIDWIASVFGNDLEFIAGSTQMCSDASSVSVQPQELVPGDVVAFQSASSGAVSHLGVIDEVTKREDMARVNFWHSWHTRDFASGLRPDFVDVPWRPSEGKWSFSHQGLNDPARYSGYDFRRPIAIAQHLGGLAGVS